MTDYAVSSTANGTKENTITLNGPISITDKTTDPEGTMATHATIGLKIEQTGKGSVYTANIATDKASSIKVTRTTASKKTANVNGIYAKSPDNDTPVNLVFTSKAFLDAVTVSATNTNKKDGGAFNAYAIRGNFGITFDGDLAAALSVTISVSSAQASTAGALVVNTHLTITGNITKAITVKAENKESGTVSAYGIKGTAITIGKLAGVVNVTANSKAAANAYGFNIGIKKGIESKLVIIAGIANAITATANASSGFAKAGGIFLAAGTFTIGTEDENADLAGNITAKGTGYTGAKAYGILAAAGLTIYGNITKNVTATAEAKNVGTKEPEKGQAEAYGISSEGGFTIHGILSGTVKATATAKAGAATAYALCSAGVLSIGEGIANITATANGTANETTAESDTSVVASGIYSKGAATITGVEDKKGKVNAITGNISATGTANAFLKKDGSVAVGNSEVSGIRVEGDTLRIDGNITKNITATATANGVKDASKTLIGGSASAWGIFAKNGSMEITGGTTGNISATATAKAGAATAYGLYSAGTLSIGEGIANAITATANGTANETTAESDTSAVASGIYSKGAVTITGAEDNKGKRNAITGNISATGTANAFLKKDGSVAVGESEVSGIRVEGNNTLKIDGNITKNITATATANGVKDASKTLISGSASAWGICVERGSMEITGDITGRITATATSKSNDAHSYGIFLSSTRNCFFSGKGTKHSFGIITVTATGNGERDEARAISCGWLVFDGTLAGTITATCKTGKAYGLYIGSVATISKDAEQMISSNINVTAKNAYAVYLKDTTDATGNVLTFEDSKLTATTSDKTDGTAYALYEASTDKVRNIELIDSTLTGDVKFNSGASSMSLISSKITGDVDMGDGDDKIQINSGSQIKGDVSNLELFDMHIFNGVADNLTMWEGEEFDNSAKLQVKFLTDDWDTLKEGKSKKILLMKDTDNSSVEWTDATTVDLYLDDVMKTQLTYNGTAVETDGFSFELDGIEKGKTTTMQLIVTKLA